MKVWTALLFTALFLSPDARAQEVPPTRTDPPALINPPVQTEKTAAEMPKVDPLSVADSLSRSLEGKPAADEKILTLEECLARVMLNNPRIKREKVLIEQAVGEKITYRSRAYPDLTLGVLAGQQGERSTVPVTPAQNFAILSGNLRQSLFEASIPAAFRRGDAGVLVAQQNFQFEAVKILHQARLAYYEALFSRATMLLFIDLQSPMEENVRQEKDRVATGLSARSSLITAEIRQLQLVPGREAARERYLGSLAKLAELMGADLKNPASVKIYPRGPLPFRPVSFNLQEATNEALQNRPDIALARAMVQVEEENKNIAKGGYYPRIDLRVDAQYLPNSILADSNSLNAVQDTRTTEAYMGPAYTWTVIDTGRVGGQVMRFQAVKERNQITLAALEQDAPRSLSEIYRALDLSKKRINALAASVQVSESNLKMIQDMINLGSATQLDFVNARNALFQTKQGMLNACYQNALARANLDLSTGRYLRYVHSEPGKK